MSHTDLISKKIEDFKAVSKLSDLQILNCLTFYIYQQQAHENDLYILAKILTPAQLSDLVSYYGGGTIKLPTKKVLRDDKILAVSFFLKEYEGWSWDKIRNFLNIPDKDRDLFSPHSLGKKISKLKESLSFDVIELLKSLNGKELHEKIAEYIKINE